MEVPCLLIWGEADSILVEGMSGGTRPYARGSVTLHTIPGCSHWVQQDQPETVNQLLWEFLLDREKDVERCSSRRGAGWAIKWTRE